MVYCSICTLRERQFRCSLHMTRSHKNGIKSPRPIRATGKDVKTLQLTVTFLAFETRPCFNSISNFVTAFCVIPYCANISEVIIKSTYDSFCKSGSHRDCVGSPDTGMIEHEDAERMADDKKNDGVSVALFAGWIYVIGIGHVVLWVLHFSFFFFFLGGGLGFS